MILGAWRGVTETDLKRVLAYSTISALGLMMMLLGIGSEMAVTSALVYLVAHAGYKGALFLVRAHWNMRRERGTLRPLAGSGTPCRQPPLRVFWPHVQWREFRCSPGSSVRSLSTKLY